MVSQSSQKQEFKAQDNLVKKLELYLNYLIQVKFMSSWRPHQNVQDIRRLQDDDHKFSALSWVHNSLIASKDFRARPNDSYGTIYQTEQHYRDYMAKSQTSNPNYSKSEYSIWDRMCTEEFIGMNEMLLERKSEALPEVRDQIVQISEETEFFDEILKIKDDQQQASTLSKSQLELITECHKLGMAIGNTESEQVTLGDRVTMSVRLAEVTLDVNHTLCALIYLTNAF